MKAVALISNNDKIKSKWQFDLVMAAISYDFDLSIVFIGEGFQQIVKNKAWKCLSRYGVDQVYFYPGNKSLIESALFKIQPLSNKQLKQLIRHADTIL